MTLSFFRALNPISKHSGIVYSLANTISQDYDFSQGRRVICVEDKPCQGQEMIDVTLGQSIRDAFEQNLDFISGIVATFNILVGTHYDLNLKGKDDCKGGAKGVLDFLILPLIARKLISDTYLPERDSFLINAAAWTIALPIEIARFSVGVALTLLLAPVVAIVHLFRSLASCLSTEQESTDEMIPFAKVM